MQSFFKFCALFLTAFLYSRGIGAQDSYKSSEPLSTAAKLRNNAVYAEVNGAAGSMLALGYERTFLRAQRFSFHGRAGLFWLPFRLIILDGFMHMNGNVEVGMLWGGRRNKLELGIGFTYYYQYTEKLEFIDPSNNGWCGCASDTKTIPMRIGYRRLSKSDTWYFQIAFTPYLFLDRHQPGDFYLNRFVEPNFGLGIGFKF